MAIQYYVASMDSSKEQIWTSFYTYRGVSNQNILRGSFRLTDFISLSVAETGYYTIKAKQGWILQARVPENMRPSLSSSAGIKDGVQQYNLKMNSSNEYWIHRLGYPVDIEPGEKLMLPAIALYTDSNVLTGKKLDTQISKSYIQTHRRIPAGVIECIGQGLPLMEKDRTIPFNYYNHHVSYETLSSTPVSLRDFSHGESRDFVYLSAGHPYTLLATQVGMRGLRFSPDIDNATSAEQAMYTSLTASGNYYIEVDKLSHVNDPNLSTPGGGLYFSDGTGTEAKEDSEYGSAQYFRSTESDIVSSAEGLRAVENRAEAGATPTYTRRSILLTNLDNVLSTTNLYDVYYNKWSIEYNSDGLSKQGTPLQFNLIAGNLYFGKWLAWADSSGTPPATTECDFVIIRKSDRKAIRIQGELSYANYKSLSCTDVSNVTNSPNQQRLRNLGYF